MVLDTDSVFHGVDRVADVPEESMPRLRPGMTLDFAGDRTWEVRSAEATTSSRATGWEQLRFSVSWKAYCFRDEAERDAWRAHTDDLTLDAVLDRLVDDLRERRLVDGDVARDADLGLLMIDTYVHFPARRRLSNWATGREPGLDHFDLVLQRAGHSLAVIDLDDHAHTRSRLRDLHRARADERHHVVPLAFDVGEHRVGLVRQSALAHEPHDFRDLGTHGLTHAYR